MTLGGSIAKWETPGYFEKIEIGTLQGPQSIRVVGGKGPPKNNALWKPFKMPRGGPFDQT